MINTVNISIEEYDELRDYRSKYNQLINRLSLKEHSRIENDLKEYRENKHLIEEFIVAKRLLEDSMDFNKQPREVRSIMEQYSHIMTIGKIRYYLMNLSEKV